VRFLDRHDRFHARHRRERFLANPIFRADYADDDAGSAPADLGVETEFTDPGDHALDLVFGRVGLSDDKHGAFSRSAIMSPGTAKCKPRATVSRLGYERRRSSDSLSYWERAGVRVPFDESHSWLSFRKSARRNLG